MRTWLAIFLASAPAGILGSGCGPAWKPGMERVQLVETPQALDLSPYQPACVPQRRVFTRRDLHRADTEPTNYEQWIEGSRRVEGSLVGCRLKRLTEYLLPGGPGPADAELPWPAELAKGGAAFFLQLDSPLPRIPAMLHTRRPTRMATLLRYYDSHGRRPRDGRLERQVAFEGFETISAGGATYTDCVRLRMDSKIRIHWGPRVDITEYVWLARGLGEVRRIEHIRGLAWLVFFDGAYCYERVDGSPTPRLASQAGDGPRRWSCIAVHLDRSLPRPRLGGLAVDLVGPASVAPAPVAPSPGDRPADGRAATGSSGG